MRKLSQLHQELIPYLYYRDAEAAIAFLRDAFGFEVRGVARAGDGAVVHAELGVGRSAVMLGPARLDFVSPLDLPARHAGVWCYVADVDAHCARARAAGAVIVREPCDQEYGVREYSARDCEGHEWFFERPLANARPAWGREPARARRVAVRREPAKKRGARRK